MSPKSLLQYFEQISEAPDAVSRLRRFILDLAVQGKLVEQDPKDEPAQILLGRNNQAIELSKNQVQSLPHGWVGVTLGQMMRLIKGKKPKNLNKDGLGYPYLDIAALERGEIRQFTDDEKCPRVSKNDLVIVCDGSRSGLVLDGRDGALGSTVAAIQFSGFIREYLSVLLNSLYENLNGAKKGAAIPHLNIPRFLSLDTGIPPLNEQYRIVAKVDELMKLCAELEATQARRERRRDRIVAATLHGLNNGAANDENGGTLSFEESARFYFNHLPRLTTRHEHIQQLRQTILNLAVFGKLLKPEQTVTKQLLDAILAERLTLNFASGDRSKIEAEFKQLESEIRNPERKQLYISTRCICDFITKGTTPATSELASRGDIPFLKVYNIVKNKLDFNYKPTFIPHHVHNKLLSRSKVHPGDVLMNIVGPPLGKVAVVTSQYLEWNVNQALAIFKPLSVIDSRFLAIALSSQVTLDQVLKDTRGVVGQDNLSLEQVRSLMVPLITLDFQKSVVRRVDELMALCDELEARITTTSTTRRQLLEATLQEALN